MRPPGPAPCQDPSLRGAAFLALSGAAAARSPQLATLLLSNEVLDEFHVQRALRAPTEFVRSVLVWVHKCRLHCRPIYRLVGLHCSTRMGRHMLGQRAGKCHGSMGERLQRVAGLLPRSSQALKNV